MSEVETVVQNDVVKDKTNELEKSKTVPKKNDGRSKPRTEAQLKATEHYEYFCLVIRWEDCWMYT